MSQQQFQQIVAAIVPSWRERQHKVLALCVRALVIRRPLYPLGAGSRLARLPRIPLRSPPLPSPHRDTTSLRAQPCKGLLTPC